MRVEKSWKPITKWGHTAFFSMLLKGSILWLLNWDELSSVLGGSNTYFSL
jgi:hypothetical protein